MSPEMMMYIITEYEKQLQKMMSPKKYKRFVNGVVKDAFLKELNNMANSDFKDVILDNIDAITDTNEEFQDALNDIIEHRDKPEDT